MTAPKLSERMASDEISAVVFQDVLPVVIALERRLASAERVVDAVIRPSSSSFNTLCIAEEHRRNFPKEPDNG